MRTGRLAIDQTSAGADGDVTFDIAIVGDKADGSTVVTFGDKNVHLTRSK